jgi:hypothetical protein
MLIQLVAAAMTLSAGTGAAIGALIARSRTHAVKAFADTVATPAKEEEQVVNAGPFRTPAALPLTSASARRSRRGLQIWKHDYDLMIGRTFSR